MQILIATRVYPLSDATGDEYTARDYMFRLPCGSFRLKQTSDMPGEPEVEETFSLEGVFEWLRELPWQIERASQC